MKKHIGNLFTGLSLITGLFGVVLFFLTGNIMVVLLSILICCLFDSLDGKFARMFNASGEFGAHFDSLVDIVVFGVVPFIVVNSLYLDPVASILMMFYVLCGAIRLARFNALKDNDNFVGLPIPLSTLILFSTIILIRDPLIVYISIASLSILMVSTFKIKKI